jgi:hypothetical protein
MPRKLRNLLLALVVVCVLATLAALVFTASRQPARPPLPNPNGYDDFVKAGEAMRGKVADFQALDRGSLSDLVSTNAESLRLLRLGLTRQCVMPMSLALTNAAGWVTQLAAMKGLVQLLAAEGRLREMEDQPARAARSYVDAMRLGNEMSRGGVLITRLIGIACEAIGCRALANFVPRLGREDARVVLAELERVDAGRVPWAEVRQNERYYCFHQNAGHFNPILGAVGWWQTCGIMDGAETKHRMIMARERLLSAELALRCYQSEQGHPPVRLDDLVTNYLSRVPQDPFTTLPMIYRPQATNWLLYSVGPDGVDDGGRPAARGSPLKGDILYDSSW